MTAEAKVILTAQDRTAAAFRSAKANLDQLNSAVSNVRSVLGAIGVGVSFAGIVNGLRSITMEAISFADEVKKASARTGIAASDFATLAEAARRADIEMATLSTGLRNMQTAISSASDGSKEQIRLFNQLGISIVELKNLKPQDQFLLISQRLSEVIDPADRARLGTQAFGKAWQDLAPFVLAGSDAIRQGVEDIKRLGGVLTPEQLDRLASADDAIDDLSAAWRGLGRTLASEVGPTLTDILRQMTDFLSGSEQGLINRQIRLLNEIEQSGGGLIIGAGARIPSGWYTPAEARQKRMDLERGLAPVAPRPRPTFNGLDPALMRESARSINYETKKAPRPSSARSEGFQISSDTLQYIEETQKRVDAYYSEIEFRGQLANSIASESADQLDEITSAMERHYESASRATDQISVFAEQAARNMQSSFSDFFYSFDGGLKGMLASFVDTIRRMVAELVASQILTAFFGAIGGGATSGWRGFFTTAAKSVGTRASGGYVMAGMPYKVGERGSELFVPRTDGTILPNHAMAGNVTLNYSIDARGADAERIMAIMPGLLKRTKDEAVGEIRSLVNRGRM